MLHEIYTNILNKSGKAAIKQLSWSSMLTDFFLIFLINVHFPKDDNIICGQCLIFKNY